MQTNDNAHAITLPPLIYLSGFLIGAVFHLFFPYPILTAPINLVSGVVLIALSIPLVVFSIRRLSDAGTAIDVRKPTTAIVSSGAYAFSRNPIYLAMTFLYAGVALLLNALFVLATLLPVLVVMHFGVIAREEKYLEQKFGEEYVRYKKNVRRWI